MAQIYKFCDGNTTVSTNITMSQSTIKSRQYTIGDTIITETYYTLTFTSSQIILEAPLRVVYSYSYRYRYDSDPYSSFVTQASTATIPVGQTSVTKDVPVTKNYCFTSGDVEGDVNDSYYLVE